MTPKWTVPPMDLEERAHDWCYWCDRPKNDCWCHLDPNGIPEEVKEWNHNASQAIR